MKVTFTTNIDLTLRKRSETSIIKLKAGKIYEIENLKHNFNLVSFDIEGFSVPKFSKNYIVWDVDQESSVTAPDISEVAKGKKSKTKVRKESAVESVEESSVESPVEAPDAESVEKVAEVEETKEEGVEAKEEEVKETPEVKEEELKEEEVKTEEEPAEETKKTRKTRAKSKAKTKSKN